MICSMDTRQRIPRATANPATASIMGFGPQAKNSNRVDASSDPGIRSGIDASPSTTVPRSPAEPSSVQIIVVASTASIDLEGRREEFLAPKTLMKSLLSFARASAKNNRGPIPTPPEMSTAVTPGPGVGNPFPRGPRTDTLSPRVVAARYPVVLPLRSYTIEARPSSNLEYAKGRLRSGSVPSPTRIVRNCPGVGVAAVHAIVNS